MKRFSPLLALLLIPGIAFADVTLTSNTTYNYLEIGTGQTLNTNGWDITVNSATGGTIVYGFLNAAHLNSDSTLFRQNYGKFTTSGVGDVLFTGTGNLLLTGTSSTVHYLTVSGALKNLTIDNGLLGYWRFDEGVGTTAKNSARQGGFNGTLQDNATWTGSSLNGTPPRTQFYNPYGIALDGVNDYVNLGAGSIHGTPFLFSVSAWVKPRAFGNYPCIALFDFGGTSNDTNGICFDKDNTQRWTLLRNDASVASSTSMPPVGTWSHLVAAYDGTGRLFLDGVTVALSTGAGGYAVAGNTIGLGFSGEEFNGAIDDVRLYNRKLSRTEAQALSNGEQSMGSGTYKLGAALDVNGSLAIYSGTLSGSTFTSTLSGNYLNVGGFSKTSSTIKLDGPSNQTLTGSTVFHNLTIISSTARTIFFAYTGRQSVSGALVLQGASSNLISLRSTRSGSGARLLLDGSSGTQTIDHLDVKDNNAGGGLTLVCSDVAEECTDSGNNTNWDFSEPPAAEGGAKQLIDYFFMMP